MQLQEVAQDYRNQPVRLGPVFDDLDREFWRPARSKGVVLNIAPSRAAVFSHPVLLRGMVRNLLRNAIDYTPPGGRIAMTCRRSARGLRIAVRDTGIGIRREAITTIFTAFARVDASRVDGLELGLFIVKRAADLLRHRIEARSIPGRGSCFTVVAQSADLGTCRSCRKRQSVVDSLSVPQSDRCATSIMTELYPAAGMQPPVRTVQ